MAFIRIKNRYGYDSVINTDQIVQITKWNETTNTWAKPNDTKVYYRFQFTNGEKEEISTTNTTDLEKISQAIGYIL